MNFLKDTKIAVTSGKDFRLKDFDPGYTAGFKDIEAAKEYLRKDIERNRKYQEMLYAEGTYSLLIIFQAMDAAGKDSTIEHVMTGINPQGIDVTSFKSPSENERAHDFLWRTVTELPHRGHIRIFNRSYYEEVLVCKVHPELILTQKIPEIRSVKDIDKKFWERRYESICDHEKHLYRNGTIILKFFLNVSKEEQRKRFIERIDNPEKNWKFSTNDVKERAFWDEYMSAYEEAIAETATEKAPWYIIPADNKWFMQMAVGDIIHDTLKSLGLEYPEVAGEEKKRLLEAKEKL
jgi:PPK2 family polyphosphate:nucleotide phosphotransferase